jgi:hypothetical protein
VDYFRGLTYYNFDKSDFPHSKKLEEFFNLCADSDTTRFHKGFRTSAKVRLSRDCSYQDFIYFLDRLQVHNFYALFYGDGPEFDLLYRNKEYSDYHYSPYIRIDYDYENANFCERIKLSIERKIPYKYYYLAQIFQDNPTMWFIIIFWLLLVLINIFRIIKYHNMRRLTRRSS